MKKGSTLILSIIIISTFLTLAVFLVKIVYNNHSSISSLLARKQAFYFAEAGIEKGKYEIARNPSWHTDPPYHLTDNAPWLIRYAIGQKNDLGEGSYKIVREKGKRRLYAVGYKGKGVVLLKITFTPTPFKVLKWEEL